MRNSLYVSLLVFFSAIVLLAPRGAVATGETVLSDEQIEYSPAAPGELYLLTYNLAVLEGQGEVRAAAAFRRRLYFEIGRGIQNLDQLVTAVRDASLNDLDPRQTRETVNLVRRAAFAVDQLEGFRTSIITALSGYRFFSNGRVFWTDVDARTRYEKPIRSASEFFAVNEAAVVIQKIPADLKEEFISLDTLLASAVLKSRELLLLRNREFVATQNDVKEQGLVVEILSENDKKYLRLNEICGRALAEVK